MRIRRSLQAGVASSPSFTLLRLIAGLLLCAVFAGLAGCASPKRVHNRHLDDFLQGHKIKLPDDLYQQIAATINKRESTYSGEYVPAGIDKNGDAVKFDGAAATEPNGLHHPGPPSDPGQMLTVNSNDPGFRDRSTAKVMMNWTPYLDKDLRREAGPQGDQYPDPITYYREFNRWKESPEGTPEPRPRVFLFVPAHFVLQPLPGGGQSSREAQSSGGVQSFGDIIHLMLKVEEIKDKETKLEAMHHLISWLKGDKLTRVGPFEVTPLINDHTTGMGLFFSPVMMFPETAPSEDCLTKTRKACELPMPNLKVALKDIMLKFTAVKGEYPFPGLFNARFDVTNDASASVEFFNSTPSGVMYEALAFTDDPIILENEQLEPDLQLKENVKKSDRGRTGDAIFRGVTLSSIMSAERDAEYGRPKVNGHVQRPPSGVPLEEASFFLHASMIHAADGWGVGAWSSSHCMSSAMVANYLGLPGAACDGSPPPPAVGVLAQWNKNADDLEATGCTESARLPEKLLPVIPHMEIYDSHLYMPHGDLKALTERYEQITITSDADKATNPLETPEQWAAIGYVAAKGTAAPDSTPRLLTFSECRDAGRSQSECEILFKSIFTAPYCGPLTRLRTSMSPAHSALPWERGLPQPNDSVARVFDEKFAETVADTVDWKEGVTQVSRECRSTVDKVVVDCAACNYVDATPIPDLPNGKSSILGEPIVFLWIHLWPYGSMYTLHNGGEQFPRYWSTDSNNGGTYAGLMSFTHFRVSGGCPEEPEKCVSVYPDEKVHNADWFISDTHKYFGAPVDRSQITRPGRGDVMYLLRHYPQAFLRPKPGVAGSNLPDPTFPKQSDNCSCTAPQ